MSEAYSWAFSYFVVFTCVSTCWWKAFWCIILFVTTSEQMVFEVIISMFPGQGHSYLLLISHVYSLCDENCFSRGSYTSWFTTHEHWHTGAGEWTIVASKGLQPSLHSHMEFWLEGNMSTSGLVAGQLGHLTKRPLFRKAVPLKPCYMDRRNNYASIVMFSSPEAPSAVQFSQGHSRATL